MSREQWECFETNYRLQAMPKALRGALWLVQGLLMSLFLATQASQSWMMIAFRLK